MILVVRVYKTPDPFQSLNCIKKRQLYVTMSYHCLKFVDLLKDLFHYRQLLRVLWCSIYIP